jgi:kynurenine formamidase
MAMAQTTTNNWGRWGDDDQRGALNVLTPAHVQRAAGAVRTGRTYSLGLPIQAEGVPLLSHRGKPVRLTSNDMTDAVNLTSQGIEEGTGFHEDVVMFDSHTTTHMDALIHVYEDHHSYNGVPSGAMQAHRGATRLGIENVGGFAARAVLLDMVRHLGADQWLEAGRMITGDDLAGAASAAGVDVGPGDVVLIRTGYLDYWFANQPNDAPSQAGIGLDAAEWLAARDVVAVGCDNAAVEVIPFDQNSFLAVHKVLLVRRGIYLLEFLDLRVPAAEGVTEGLITIAPLLVTGATGSPINPILIT